MISFKGVAETLGGNGVTYRKRVYGCIYGSREEVEDAVLRDANSSKGSGLDEQPPRILPKDQSVSKGGGETKCPILDSGKKKNVFQSW